MRTYILFISLFFLSFFATNAQELQKISNYYDSAESKTKEVYFIADGDSSQIEGDYKKYYESGELMAKGTFEKGKGEGSFEMFYPNGKLMRTTEFEDGSRTGKTIVYGKEGNVLQEASFESDTLNGKLKL